MNQDAVYWLALTLVKGMGAKTIVRLVQACGSARLAWEAPPNLLHDAQVAPALIQALVHARQTLDLTIELKKVAAASARLITLDDADYPINLRSIDAAPPLLYVRGDLSEQDQLAVAIVGTRSATSYGRDATYKLARELAYRGVTIVSGLAEGIDTAAHRGALAANGRTLAILGCGIDRIYPDKNKSLADEILARNGGALISEFPVGMPPTSRNFPRRNRILSGIALAVLVTEAPEGSGALITADHALEQGRDVFALPANILIKSGAGTNRLIKEGARLITSADEILEELAVTPSAALRPIAVPPIHQPRPARKPAPVHAPPTAPPADLTDPERTLFDLLTKQPLHIDELIRASGLRADAVISTITLLELKGLAQMVAPMQYCRSHF